MSQAPPPESNEPPPGPYEPPPPAGSPRGEGAPSTSAPPPSPPAQPAATQLVRPPAPHQPYAPAGYTGHAGYPGYGNSPGYGGYPGYGSSPGYGGYSGHGGYRPTAPGQVGVSPLPGISRIQPVGGTPFAYAYVRVPAVTSGLAIGSLIAGIASIAVALGMVCLGLSGASDGWGALVAGAFAILSIVLGAAGIAFGRSATRLIRRAAGTMTGAGMANAGMICGWVGVGVSVIGFFGTLAATLSG